MIAASRWIARECRRRSGALDFQGRQGSRFAKFGHANARSDGICCRDPEYPATSPDKDAHGGSAAFQDDDELRLRRAARARPRRGAHRRQQSQPLHLQGHQHLPRSAPAPWRSSIPGPRTPRISRPSSSRGAAPDQPRPDHPHPPRPHRRPAGAARRHRRQDRRASDAAPPTAAPSAPAPRAASSSTRTSSPTFPWRTASGWRATAGR